MRTTGNSAGSVKQMMKQHARVPASAAPVEISVLLVMKQTTRASAQQARNFNRIK